MGRPILKSLEGIPSEATELTAQLLLANAQENLSVANNLREIYLVRALTAEATLSLVREHIEDLFSGPYLPNTGRVMDALYPDRDLIRLRAENGE